MIWPHPLTARLRQFVLSVATVLIAALALVPGASGQNDTSRVLSSSFAQSIATDTSGNVYYAGTNSSATVYQPDGIYEMMAVNGTIPANPVIRKLPTALPYPAAVAVDGKGNVFVIGGATPNPDSIAELVAVNGSVPDNATIRTLITGYTFSSDLAFSADAAGDIAFYTEIPSVHTTFNINEIAAINGAIPDNPTVLTVASYTEPSGGVNIGASIGLPILAPSGDLFYVTVANGASQVMEVPVDGTASRVVYSSIGAGIDSMTLDASGNLFINEDSENADGSYQSAIEEVKAVNGEIPATPVETQVYSALTTQFSPRDIAVDSNENLFVANENVYPPLQNILELSPGVAGTLTIAPTMQAFPATPVDSVSMAQTSTITNGTTQSIYLSAGTLTDASDFAASNNCGGILNNGKSCTVTFTFTPQSGGALTSTYSIHNLNTPNTPLTVALSGNGNTTPAQATLTPATFDFGNLQPGASSDPQTFTLTNTGTAALSISSITLGNANGNFSVVSDGCASTYVSTVPVRGMAFNRARPYDLPPLPPHASCTIVVGFLPTTSGNFSATLNVVDAAGTQTSTLTGVGTGTATAALTPPAGTFGTIPAGAYNEITFSLVNQGTAALSISSIAITGANASTFSINSDTCATANVDSVPGRRAARAASARLRPLDSFPSLPAGSSCNITVFFSPTTSGTFSASLNVVDAVGTQTAALTGTAAGAEPSGPQAALTPATANFGSVTSGTTGSKQTFTLTNAGGTLLPITAVSITGTNASAFTISGANCGNSLAAGASCTIPITFTPGSTGNLTATLAVTDSVGTQTSALSGTGTASTVATDFTISATPSTQSSYRGTSVSYSILLNSAMASSPFTSQVALTAAGLPTGASVSFSPSSVVPGTTQPTTSMMTVTIPQLYTQNTRPSTPRPFGSLPAGASLASLGFVWLYRKRKKLAHLNILLAVLSLAGIAATLMGCGSSSTGFAIPTSTSTITVTGTSGSIAHSTIVTLTIK